MKSAQSELRLTEAPAPGFTKEFYRRLQERPAERIVVAGKGNTISSHGASGEKVDYAFLLKKIVRKA